jgi:hypothetical protein
VSAAEAAANAAVLGAEAQDRDRRPLRVIRGGAA